MKIALISDTHQQPRKLTAARDPSKIAPVTEITYHEEDYDDDEES
jgi:hypothetical protein